MLFCAMLKYMSKHMNDKNDEMMKITSSDKSLIPSYQVKNENCTINDDDNILHIL